MLMQEHLCPACGRKFKNIRDSPRVLVLSFELLPLPEAVDQFSDAAAHKRLARKRHEGPRAKFADMDGINRTPEIADACARQDVQDYLQSLTQLAGQTVTPSQLEPPFERSGYFRWAHKIPQSKLFLALGEGVPTCSDERVAELEIHCAGPNMGSAGGPTLQTLGSIGRLHYQGLLL